jgi:4-hydroxy-4-methyl-2-oxoglutarate aldolase
LNVLDANLQRARALETATLSDAMDRLGIVGQCSGIHPRDPGFKLAGRARTILYGPAGKPAGTVGDYIDDIEPGEVMVLDNGGREDVTVWGDILTEIASRRELGGTVIDGICRDVACSRRLGYPVFARNHWMRTGKDRVQVEAYDVPVTVGGARVVKGDILIGDADGVVIIPKGHEDEILKAAEEIHAVEEAIRDAVRGGMRLADARRINNYHHLQTRTESV